MNPSAERAYSILVVDDDVDFAEGLAEVLQYLGYTIGIANRAGDAPRVMADNAVRIAFVDLKLATANGLELIQSLKQEWPDCLFVLMTAYSSLDSAVEALHVGAYDYLRKPFSVEELKMSLARATDRLRTDDLKRAAERDLAVANDELRQINDRLGHLVSITRDFVGCTRLTDLYPALLRAFADSMGASGGSLYAVRPDRLELVTTLDPGHAPQEIPLPLAGPGVFETVLTAKQPLLLPDIREAKNLLPSGWTGYADTSLLAFPLLDGEGAVHAVLSLHSKESPPFSRMDLDLGVILAGHVCETLRATVAFESLLSSERKYRDLTEGSIQGICVHNGTRFLFANDAFRSMFGFEDAQDPKAMGHPVKVLPAELLAMQGHDAALHASPQSPSAVSRLFDVRHRSGAQLWIEAVARGIRWEDEPALQVTAVDVTARIQAEEKMRNQHRQLVHADKLAALGTLVSGIAHEVNNPINLIGLNISLMHRVWGDLADHLRDALDGNGNRRIGGLPADRIPETVTRLINGIEDGSQRVQHIVSRLRDFSQKQEVSPYGAVDLNGVLESAIELTRGEIRKATQRFTAEIDAELPQVRGNRIELAQVLVNLIANACQALTSMEQAVSVRSFPDGTGANVIIEVVDEGVGIPEENLISIFDPFFTTRRQKGGTGLGLYVCYGIVREHGGQLELTSQPNAGVCARLTLPVWQGR